MEELLATVKRLGSVRAAARHHGLSYGVVARRLGDSNPRRGATNRAAPGPLSVEQQHEVIERFLAETPDPVSLLWLRPGLANLALGLGMSRDDLLSDVYYAVVLSARKYDPTRLSFKNVVAVAACSVLCASVKSTLKHRRAHGMLRRVQEERQESAQRVSPAASRKVVGHGQD